MQTWITDVGIDKLAISHANGLKIQFANFGVGRGIGTGGTATVALENERYGPISVDAVRFIDDHKWEVDTFIPSSWPDAGSEALTEAGLYLEDGTLFAYATFDVKTKENASEMMLRWTFVIAQASPTDITVTGSCFTINFRGQNTLVNSEFRALGFKGLAADGVAVDFVYGDALQSWKVWDEAETGGNLMSLEREDGIELISAAHGNPIFLIQDLPASLISSAAGGNILLRVRVKGSGGSPSMRIGFLFDRGLGTEYLSTVDYDLTSSYATYSATKMIPAGSPVVTNSIAVVIAPLTADKLHIEWSVCNIEDEEVYYVQTNVNERVIEGEIVYPDITAAELQTVLDEVVANRDTNSYPIVYMAPGVYNLNASVDKATAILATLIPGETKIVLDDANIDIRLRELWDIEVETGTITSATNPAVRLTSARGTVRITGSRDDYILSLGGGTFDDLIIENTYNNSAGAVAKLDDCVGRSIVATATGNAYSVYNEGEVSVDTIDSTGCIYVAASAKLIARDVESTALGDKSALGVNASGHIAIQRAELTDVSGGYCLDYRSTVGSWIGHLSCSVGYKAGLVPQGTGDHMGVPPLVIDYYAYIATTADATAITVGLAGMSGYLLPLTILDSHLDQATYEGSPVDLSGIRYFAQLDLNLKIDAPSVTSGVLVDIAAHSAIATTTNLRNGKIHIILLSTTNPDVVLRLSNASSAEEFFVTTNEFLVNTGSYLPGTKLVMQVVDDAYLTVQQNRLVLNTGVLANKTTLGGASADKFRRNHVLAVHASTDASYWTAFGVDNIVIGVGKWTLTGVGAAQYTTTL